MEPVVLRTLQIEALLKKINEENRKTKEVLETIHRTHDEAQQHKETTTKVVLSRGNVISLGSKVRGKCDSQEASFYKGILRSGLGDLLHTNYILCWKICGRSWDTMHLLKPAV